MVEIAIAVKELNIAKDVIIAFNNRLAFKSTAGNHTYKAAEECHVIKLNGYLSINSASDTLWHELTHAMQAERYAIMNDSLIELFDTHYQNVNGNYWTNDYEIEARRIAFENRERMLVK
jgi:hypothetical protein